LIERLLRVENLVVIPLPAVGVFVALGARWRNDPGRARTAWAINRAVVVGLAVVVTGIAGVIGAVMFLAPIRP